jgi:1-acyl-sn-glycerol-3-phosphate acyltransferase
MMPAFYSLIRLAVLLLLRWRTAFAVTGAAHVPAREAVIIAANHCSYLDFLVLGAAVRRRLVFLVATEYFARPGPRAFLRFFRSIPTERRKPDPSVISTVRAAVRTLRRGEALAIFPEGWATAEPLPARAGVALLAAQCGAPVVPVAIVGTDRVLPRGARRPARHPVRVHIGAPLPPPPARDRAAYAAFTRQVMGEIDRLGAVGGESPAAARAGRSG